MEHTRNNTQAVADVPAGGPGSPGGVLAAARKARGMSIEDVARRLRLTPAQVHAIETDNHAFFPAAVFARGFTRGYARLVEVDIGPLLPAQAGTMAAMPTDRLRSNDPGVPLERKKNRHLPAMIVASVLVLSGLTYYEFVINAPPAQLKMAGGAPVVTTQPAAVPVPAPAVTAAPVAGELSSTAPVMAPQQDAPGQSLDSDNLQLKKSTDPLSGLSGPASRDLHFMFNNESWVEVRDAVGKVVYSRLNAPGSESVVQGEPPFSIVIGGASGVQLSYKGSRVDIASYMSEDVARLRLE